MKIERRERERKKEKEKEEKNSNYSYYIETSAGSTSGCGFPDQAQAGRERFVAAFWV